MIVSEQLYSIQDRILECCAFESQRSNPWKAFKITLGIVLGLLAIPTVIAIITAVKLSN